LPRSIARFVRGARAAEQPLVLDVLHAADLPLLLLAHQAVLPLIPVTVSGDPFDPQPAIDAQGAPIVGPNLIPLLTSKLLTFLSCAASQAQRHISTTTCEKHWSRLSMTTVASCCCFSSRWPCKHIRLSDRKR
jgi:hypothetical protein